MVETCSCETFGFQPFLGLRSSGASSSSSSSTRRATMPAMDIPSKDGSIPGSSQLRLQSVACPTSSRCSHHRPAVSKTLLTSIFAVSSASVRVVALCLQLLSTSILCSRAAQRTCRPHTLTSRCVFCFCPRRPCHIRRSYRRKNPILRSLRTSNLF